MLWITPDLYHVEISDQYSEEKRYLDTEPSMKIQGERSDILASMADNLVEDFNNNLHLQHVVSESGLSKC
jgi:ferritin-like metal-binding protein YciE